MTTVDSAFAVAMHEMTAVATMQLLSGKPVTMTLGEEQQRVAQGLASALKRGDKAHAFRLSAEFYPHVMPQAELARAYYRVHDEAVEANSNFQIVMDSLKENYGHTRPDKVQELPLDDALLMLLLAITYSDKNSIYYSRLDEATGKVRPTTFPLTEKVVKDFLAPFGDRAALIKRVLVIQKGSVIGNPASQVAWLYGQRKKAWEEQQKLAAAAQSQAPKLADDPRHKQRRQLQLLSADFDNMLKSGADADEKNAHRYAFQGNQLKRLIDAISGDGKVDFKQRLEEIYAEKITRQKAGLMAMKLSIKLKRMMSDMGTWDNEIWREFQGRMQELGIWDGSDWLAKWNADKTGKQHIAKAGKDYLIQEKPAGLDDLLAQSDKIKDKQRGRRMLERNTEIPPEWLKSRQPSTTHEQRKALDALARQERLDDLIDLSLEPESWEALDSRLQTKIYIVFASYSYLDMPIIKDLILHDIDSELSESAKNTILALEFQYNKIVKLFEQDPRLTYADAVERLFAQQEEEAEKARLNSLEYQRSPAAQYGKYKK